MPHASHHNIEPDNGYGTSMYPKKPSNQLSRTRVEMGRPYRLIFGVELVVEAFAGNNRALRDEGGTIGVIGMLLEKTVPVL